MASVAKLQRMLRELGPAEVVRRAAVRVSKTLRTAWRRFSPRWILARRRGAAFDRKYGTTTAGATPMADLAIASESAALGTLAESSPDDQVESILDELGIRFEEFGFVDIGAGRGRVVLLASTRPFRFAWGVEFSSELCEEAKRNVARFREARPTAVPIELHCADATEFALPAGDLVVYLFNPFRAPILEQFVARLERSLADQPRRILVIYANPKHVEVLEASNSLERVRMHDEPLGRSRRNEAHSYAIYRSAPQP
jgi:hypothetical protein